MSETTETGLCGKCGRLLSAAPDGEASCWYCDECCVRCDRKLPTRQAEEAKAKGAPLRCDDCERHRQGWIRRDRYWTIAKVTAVLLVLVGWIGAVVLFGGDDESEWCKTAREVADGLPMQVINQIEVEEAMSIIDQQYRALANQSESRVIRRAALDARPADFSGVSLDRRMAARRQLSRHAERECGGGIRF